jgi:colicin import membrane protein
MSTVPSRRTTKPADMPQTGPVKKRKKGAASFRYGYRDIPIKLKNGDWDIKRVPLTLEDVLHPQLGDVHVLGDPHDDDCVYLKTVLKARYVADRSVVVFHDCGIFWDVPSLKHLSPDISVIFGVKKRKDWTTFHVEKEKVRPSLIIEITSRSTRRNDVVTKVKQYARAGVLHYVMADAAGTEGRRKLTLIAYRLEGKRYVRLPLDELGRAWLEPVGLWLGVTVDPDTGGDRVVLIDPATKTELPGLVEANRLRAEAESQAHAAAERAAAEAEARLQAEARARKLEAELNRLRRRKD